MRSLIRNLLASKIRRHLAVASIAGVGTLAVSAVITAETETKHAWLIGKKLKEPLCLEKLENRALRQLCVQKEYSAAIDCVGDLYVSSSTESQWCAVSGLDLKQMVISGHKIYAVSKKGKVWAVDISRHHTERSIPWWSWWAIGGSAQFTEITSPENDPIKMICAGVDHLLALSWSGTIYSHAISPSANIYGQLGTRSAKVGSILLNANPTQEPTNGMILHNSSLKSPENDTAIGSSSQNLFMFSTQLMPIQSLSKLQIKYIAAADHSSYAVTHDDHLLVWGSNKHGQLALSMILSQPGLAIPTELSFANMYPRQTRLSIEGVYAGSNNAYVDILSEDRDGKFKKDIWALGQGTLGGLGNAQWSSLTYSPVRMNSLSGIMEYSETMKKMCPLVLDRISVGSTGHAFVIMNSLANLSESAKSSKKFGKDVFAIGAGGAGELGTGKKSNQSVPQNVQASAFEIAKIALTQDGSVEPVLESDRLQLRQGCMDLISLSGKLMKRNQPVEQDLVAGWQSSVLYWRCS